LKVLIIGGGGREHSLAAALARDQHEIFVAPGNAGIAREFCCLPLLSITKVLSWCNENHPAFVLIGPEQPLAEGWADILAAAGIPCVGPCQAAAKIESSKAFAKDLMSRSGIPTASHILFTSSDEARKFIQEKRKYPLVIKADALCAGKGVFIVSNEAEALAALNAISGPVLVEEYLRGWEVSLFAISDGENFQTTLFAQDYKQLEAGDKGPNTGGMGACCPVPEAEQYRAEIERSIVKPILAGLKDEGCPYRGFLYCGLMITAAGPKVLEFNCRLGDPEAQALLPLLQTTLTEVCEAVIQRRVKDLNLVWSKQASVCVVLASQGYPGRYRKDVPIDFIRETNSLIRFSGVTAAANGLMTSGGRVLSLVGIGDNLEQARCMVYQDIEAVDFAGKYYRRDIALRKNTL